MEDLPIQNMVPYNKYGPYQCSWFAAGCVANKTKLLNTWLNDEAAFRELYTAILEEATELRGTTNPEAKHIQTLFYPAIFDHYKLEVDQWFHFVANPELPDTMTESHAQWMSNAHDVAKTKLSFPHQTFEALEKDLSHISEHHSFLGHRNGQAFVGLPIPNTKEFLLLDDHFPCARLCSIDEFMAWVRKRPENAYCLFFWSTTARLKATN